MSDDELTAEDHRAFYNEWLEEYGYVDYIEFSDENWEKVQQMNTRLIWTDHGTCENPMVTNGARLYSGRCCWDTYGWYVMSKPWEGPEDSYESVETAVYLACSTCNADSEEEDINSECPECEGEGYVNHYFD
jgi:hypothetical protein